jgi:hypothetical protein
MTEEFGFHSWQRQDIFLLSTASEPNLVLTQSPIYPMGTGDKAARA